jgi:uncharacterized protein (DUF58 family)
MSETVVLVQFPFSAHRTTAENREITKQRVYIMPTRHGAVFGLMLIAMLLGAVNYNNSMAYILTFLLCSLALVTLLHTCRNLAGLAINQAPASAVFPGELAKFPLILDNRNSQLRLSISFIKTTKKWRLLADVLTSTGNEVPITSCDVDTNAFNHIELPVKAEQRGLLYAGRIKVFTTFPLGLFKAWSYIEMKQPCLVYPKPAGQNHFPAYKLTEATGSQGSASGTDDFIGFRNYQTGDSIKDIAWKAYAQQKGLFIKRFSGSGADKLHLSWADVAALADIETRLSQLCHWIIEAESQSLQYSLELPELFIDSGHGEEHLHQCLSALAKYGLENGLEE